MSDAESVDLDAPSDPTAQADRAQRTQQAGGGLARDQVGRPWRLELLRPRLSRHADRDHGRAPGHRSARLVPAGGRGLLVLIAELAHSAVDTLARAIGDPEEPRLKTAREIAAGGVLVAAVGSGAVTVIVLSWKFAQLLSGGS